MNTCVLFSPVGRSDPVSRGYDGSLLHIVRHKKPARVYLFMSAEVCAYDERDDRYAWFLRRVSEAEGFPCEIIKYKPPEIDKPNDYDAFYALFESYINAVAEQNPGAQLLVNLSSGTPQMKNTCHLLCALSPHPLVPCQVDPPDNGGMHCDLDFNTQAAWDSLNDNRRDPPTKVRLKAVRMENFNARLTREQIKTLLDCFDYDAAARIAEPVRQHLNPGTLDLLNAARDRLAQDGRFAAALSAEKKAALLRKAEPEERTVYEYLLMLGVRRERGDLTDFVRGLSPVLTDLFYWYLKNNCKTDVKQAYCEYNNKKKICTLKRDKLEPPLQDHLDAAYNREFRDTELAGNNLAKLISYFEKNDNKLIKSVNTLAEYEQLIRNKAAHEIVNVSEAWIDANGPERKGAGKQGAPRPSEHILGLLRAVYLKAFRRPADWTDWNDYRHMNKVILNALDTPPGENP